MKNGMCVCDCVRACDSVCVCVANGCTYMFDSLGSEGVKIEPLIISLDIIALAKLDFFKMTSLLMLNRFTPYFDKCNSIGPNFQYIYQVSSKFTQHFLR